MRYFAYYFLIFCILVSSFLRFYNVRFGTQFEWDQEFSVARPARNLIVNRDPPLIGARIGFANLYVAPLYTYLAALFFFIFNLHPIAGAYLAASLSVVTIMTTFFLVKKIFTTRFSLLFTTLLAVSPFVVYYDRIPWNVNLLPLASICFFGGLWMLEKKDTATSWIYIGLGLFLGSNAHLSVLIWPFILLALLFLKPKFRSRKIIFAIAGLALGMLPLMVFDLTHQGSIRSGLRELSQNSSFYLPRLLQSIPGKFQLLLETLGRLLLFNSLSQTQIFVGFIFSFVFFFKKSISLYQKSLVGISFFVYLVGLVLVPAHTPDYYVLGLVPLFLFIITQVIFADGKNLRNTILMVTLPSFLLAQSVNIIMYRANPSLGDKEAVVKAIKSEAQNRPVHINLDMDFGTHFGYDYFFEYFKLHRVERDSSQLDYWISYPTSRITTIPDYVSGEIALVLSEKTAEIYATKMVALFDNLALFRVPNTFNVTTCHNPNIVAFSENELVNCDTSSLNKSDLLVLRQEKCTALLESDITYDLPSKEILFKKVASPIRIEDIPLEATDLILATKAANNCVVFIQYNPQVDLTIISRSLRLAKLDKWDKNRCRVPLK